VQSADKAANVLRLQRGEARLAGQLAE